MQKKIELIDFRGKFAEYFMKWSVEHREEIEQKEMDEQMLYEELYEKWMDTENPDLGDVSPRNYFRGVDDKRLLVSALIDYLKEGIQVPDALLDSIVEEKEETYPLILSILMDDNAYDDLSEDVISDLRAECIGLIWNMGMEHPYLRYVELLLNEKEESSLADILCSSLMDRGEDIDDRLLDGYEGASLYARTCIIDILTNDNDERAKDLIISELAKKDMNRLYLCSKLINYYGEDVAGILLDKVKDPSNDYYTYRELRNIYEEYTGDILEQEDFSGDPTYELERYIFEDEQDEG